VINGVYFEVDDPISRIVPVVCRRLHDGSAELTDANISPYITPPWNTKFVRVSTMNQTNHNQYTIISGTSSVTHTKALHQKPWSTWKGSILVVKHADNIQDLVNMDSEDEIADLTRMMIEMGGA
jgi:hypothetical protein